MSAIWFHSLIPNATGPLHSVFLMLDPDREETDQGVTRYLVTELEGRLLPFGVDRFDSEAEAKQRCKDDLGIETDAWRQAANEPDFHAPVAEAREEAIENYLADAERRVRASDDTAFFERTRDDL